MYVFWLLAEKSLSTYLLPNILICSPIPNEGGKHLNQKREFQKKRGGGIGGEKTTVHNRKHMKTPQGVCLPPPIRGADDPGGRETSGVNNNFSSTPVRGTRDSSHCKCQTKQGGRILYKTRAKREGLDLSGGNHFESRRDRGSSMFRSFLQR